MSERKDAARTRRAILDAAQELLQVDQEASHAEIAKAADVGRASVYRHFPERSDLVAALLVEMLGRLQHLADAHDGVIPLIDLLRATAREQAQCQGLISIMRRDGVAPEQFEELTERALALFADPFAAAQREGTIRADLALDDMLLLLEMIEGALAPVADPVTRGERSARALDLALQGVLQSVTGI
jgi:AcrR family transcriptional regulator